MCVADCLRHPSCGVSTALNSAPVFSNPSRKCASRDSRPRLVVLRYCAGQAACPEGTLELYPRSVLVGFPLGELFGKRNGTAGKGGLSRRPLRCRPEAVVFLLGGRNAAMGDKANERPEGLSPGHLKLINGC